MPPSEGDTHLTVLRPRSFHSTLPAVATHTREVVLLPLPAVQAEQALDSVLAERGFGRAELPAPESRQPVARSEQRFFAVEETQPGMSIVREWSRYSDATAWGAALELAEGL